MIDKIKKNFAKIGALVAVFGVGLMTFAKKTYAAADATLESLTASSTSFLGDNLTVIMSFITTNFFKIVGAGLGILALYWIARKIYSLFRR